MKNIINSESIKGTCRVFGLGVLMLVSLLNSSLYLQAEVVNPGGDPYVTVSSTAQVAAAANSTALMSVTSNASWTATTPQTWLSVSPSIATYGNATLTLTASANTGAERTAVVTLSATGVADQKITVTQKAKPVITSFTPDKVGSGSTVTIIGTYFTGTTAISIGGTSVKSFKVDSDTQISAIMGTEATGTITVTTPGGIATSASSLTWATGIVSTAGNLATTITNAGLDLATVKNLTFTGTIDQRDFVSLRDEMPLLEVIDMSVATIMEYNTGSGEIYPANGIPGYAFSIGSVAKTSLTSVIMPSSLTSIGIGAFYDCKGLSGILTIPSGVITISSNAFTNCNKITGTLTLPSALKSIGNYAFDGCEGLTGALNIPMGVTEIGDNAFTNCVGLNGDLTLPSTITKIGKEAFYNCQNMTGELIIPPHLTIIEDNTFYNCQKLTGSINIKSLVTSVGERAFYLCKGLDGTLTIPSTVTSIGNSAFAYCEQLTGTIALPTSLTIINNNIFRDCKKLTGSLAIPSGNTTIGSTAFAGCIGLNGTLTIPTTVTTINQEAFSDCSGLTGDLTIPTSVKTLGDGAFSGCFGFNGSLSIPSSLTSISNNVFKNCTGLTGSLTIPSTVTSIGISAFSGCNNLTSVSIPSGVTSIGAYALSCSKLSTISVDQTTPIVFNNLDFVFHSVDKQNCLLSVPTDSNLKYATATLWSDFFSIISPTPTLLNTFSTGKGVASTPTEKITVGLSPSVSTDLVVTAPSGYEIRENGTTGAFGSSVTFTKVADVILSKTIEIRLAENAPLGTVSGDVVCTSGELTTKKMTVTGEVINLTPTDIALSASSINENVTANSEVGTLSSTDPNSANTFTYTLVTGDGSTDNASFNISGSSLRITNSPDFETKSSYSVRVRTTDQGNLTFEKAFIITINDVNETPTDIALSASAINENVVANSAVGTLSSTDPDAANTFTYTLVAGTDDTDNAAFDIDGSNLRIIASPDFEAKNSYKVRVRSTDQGGLLYTEKAFTITINDVIGDAPTLTTQAVTNIGLITATGNGTITSLGIPNPTQYGVVWSTATNPTVALSTKTTIGAGATIGAFTSNMTGLTANTLYYVKAYATNNAGTNYGNEVTFTTSAFTLTSSSSILSIGHSAGSKVGANVTSNTSWNISSNQSWLTVKVTIIVSAPEKVGSVQEKVITGSPYPYLGNKPIVLTASANPSTSTRTAYVTLSANGLSDRTITVTQEAGLASTVTTQAVTAIDAFTATGNGTIEDLGCSNPTAHGVCWNTTGTPTITDSKVDIGTASATGAFTAPITGLSASKTYYVRAYATNGSETSYGDEVTFTTSGPAITFISSKNDFVQFSLALTANATFYVDWGDGTLVPKTGSTGELFYNTSSYVAENTVKIYGATIALFTANTQNLTNLVVNENTTLLALGCSSNQLTSLDISKSTALETLWCNNNQLTTLDVTKNTALLILNCNTNQLTTLDVTKNTKLTNFVCYSNQLSTLDVSKNIALVELSCSSNRLTALNTSQNAVLESLSCDNNKLTLLDVSKNNSLTGLSCDNNKLSLTSLPQRKSDYGYYYYAPQAILAASASNGIVDLSSQLTANDIETKAQTTVYTWRTKTNGDDLILDTDYTLSNGVFTFLKTPADSIACYMSNAAFPDFKFSNALRTVYLKFTAGPAIVSTKTVTDITSITANVNAEITDFGIDKPTQHGVVWSTSTNPTEALSTKTTEGKVSDVGTYTSEITGLKANTTYYVRAYATNSFDTSYGTELSFTTSCGNETLPYSQGFNASTLPNCWNQQYVTGTTDLQFPDNEAPEGTNYVSINNQNSSSSYEETRLVSPAINTLAIKSVDVQFKWNYYNGFVTNDYVDVEYSTDGVNWNEVSKIYKFGVDDYGWTLKSIRLPQGALNKATIYIGFKFHATFWAELSMDDVKIIATTIKPEPTNQASNFAVGTVTTNGIPVTWTAADAGTQAPDGYLIKLNESAVVNPEDEVTPTDVTSVTNGEANIFVPSNVSGSSNTITGLTPGTMYNYSIFSYTNTGAIIDFNLTSAPSLYHATLPESVNGASFALTGTTTANISWTLPATYNSANHSTLVFVKAVNDINAGTPSNLLSSYEANSIFGLGTALQYDAAAHCVYKGDGTNVSITQLAANTSYYVIVYTVVDAVNFNGTNSYSDSNSTSYKIAPSSQVTNFAKNVVGSTSISLKWTAATGSQAPDGYLIKLNTSNIDNPANGTDPADVMSLTNNAANKKVISGTATSASSFSGLKAGTMYNYKIYSYTNSGTQINFNLNSAPVLSQATLPAKVSGQSYTLTGSTTANIVWTSAASYDKSKHSTLVFVKQASAINTETPTNAPASYTASSVIGSGTVYQHDAAAYCVYKGDGNSVSITGLTENEAYYVSIYTVMDASNSDNTNSYSKVATIANGTVPSNDIWATNGDVYKVISDDVYTYIAGDFSSVSHTIGTGAKISTASTTPDLSFAKVNGIIITCIPDGNGGWYIGGEFTKVGSSDRNYLAQINAAGEVTSWNPNPNGNITNIVLSGTDIYITGSFSSIGGENRNRIAKLNSNGIVVSEWNPNPEGSSLDVNCITFSGSDIYVGGSFSSIGGQSINNLAKLNNTNGNAIDTWKPEPDNDVRTIAINGTDIYVSGDFNNIGGQNRSHLAKLNSSNGNADVNWNPNPDNHLMSLNSIKFNGQDIYVSGYFFNIGGQNRSHLAKLNSSNGNADENWNPNSNNDYITIRSIAISGNNLYIGGSFSEIAGELINNIAKINLDDGSLDPSWNANPDNAVNCIAINGTDMYIGGCFGSLEGIVRNNIARFNNSDASLDNNWKPIVNGSVQTMALNGDNIYIGGQFSNVEGEDRNALAKLNTTTGMLDANWKPNPEGEIYSIASQGNDVYVGGGFNYINDVERIGIAKLNNSDGAVSANWNANADNVVASIEIDGSDIYVGGMFRQIGGEARNSIARINTTNGNADSWNPNLDPNWEDGFVSTTTGNTTDIYISGQFASIGGTERGNVAKISKLDGSLDANWKPMVDGGVTSLLLDGADVYIAGEFTTIDGETRNNIAKLNTGNAVIDAWNPNADGMIYSMSKVDDDIYVGGEFYTIDSKMQQGIAKVKAAVDYSLLYVTLSSVSVPIAAVNNSKASIDITSNTTWNVSIDPAKTWLTANQTTVTGDAELIFTATENTSDSPRSAEVNISAVGKSTQTITVTQAACGLTLGTQAVTDIEATKATGNGTITVLGTPRPTAHGVCWNTSGTPTITDSKVDKGAANSIGAFTASITGLTAGTTYYVRAYATTGGITTYGNEVNFTYLSTESTISTTISTPKSDIVIPDTKTMIIDNASKTINSITVNAGAKLTINNLLTVSDVILKSDANNKSFNISNTVAEGSHSMLVSGLLKYVKTMDETRWYFMSFPCNIKVSDIKQANGSPMGTLGTQWLIKYYDGESRVQNLGKVSNWKSVLITDSLKANKGYAFGLNYDTPTTMDVAFILDKNLVEHPESNKSIGTIAHGKGMTTNSNNVIIGETHKGWNLVGQPYLSKYQVSNTNVNLMLFADGLTGKTYSTIETFKGKIVDPFVAYFVQADAALESSGITFSTSGRQSAPSAVAFDLSDRVQLNFTTATGTDYTNLKMDNNQSVDYRIGEDMEKWLGTGTAKPQVYTILGGVNYAYNGLPISSVVNLPVGIYTQTASSCTISVDATSAPSLSQLLLTDKSNGKVTDLLTSSYSFTAAAGINNSRFTITAQRIPTETTVENESDCPTLTINNSKLIINNLNGETHIRVYDAVGRMLVNKTTSNSSLEIPIEVVGMYTVQMEVGAKRWVRKIVANHN